MVFILCGARAQSVSEDTCRLVNAWRAENDLPPVQLSPTMTELAAVHARNVDAYWPSAPPQCNEHSWFDDLLQIERNRYQWRSCCYSSVAADALCMANKGRELFNYTGRTFENSARGSALTPSVAVEAWKRSQGHNMLLLSDFMHVCGAAQSGRLFFLWMGDAPDSTVPIATPRPTPQPTALPSARPTPRPTVAPSNAPSPSPTHGPTAAPTAVPSVAPTLWPTDVPPAAERNETSIETTPAVATTIIASTLAPPHNRSSDVPSIEENETTAALTHAMLVMGLIAASCVMLSVCACCCAGLAYWLGFRPRSRPPKPVRVMQEKRRAAKQLRAAATAQSANQVGVDVEMAVASRSVPITDVAPAQNDVLQATETHRHRHKHRHRSRVQSKSASTESDSDSDGVRRSHKHKHKKNDYEQFFQQVQRNVNAQHDADNQV